MMGIPSEQALWQMGKTSDEWLAEHDKQIRTEVIDEVEKELLSHGFIFTEHALEVWHEIAEQLKENK